MTDAEKKIYEDKIAEASWWWLRYPKITGEVETGGFTIYRLDGQALTCARNKDGDKMFFAIECDNMFPRFRRTAYPETKEEMGWFEWRTADGRMAFLYKGRLYAEDEMPVFWNMDDESKKARVAEIRADQEALPHKGIWWMMHWMTKLGLVLMLAGLLLALACLAWELVAFCFDGMHDVSDTWIVIIGALNGAGAAFMVSSAKPQYMGNHAVRGRIRILRKRAGEGCGDGAQ